MSFNPADHKIMVIDDDLESAKVMAHHLRTCGYRVVSLKSGSMVLKKVLNQAPALIIIDLMSPGRTGLGLCRELTTNYATRHIPIVMVTATGDESDKLVALELGADDYLSKPFSLHELDLRVERSLDRFYAAKNAEAQ
jgi:DNA-binding response OmpR family regulator